MIKSYRTVLTQSTAEISVKKSRFIALCAPVSTEEEANELILATKKLNHSAAHNVFAFRIGLSDEIERATDDGEPAQTAGVPILEVLRVAALKNTIIIVTRYFGGTLLGTGGLVRAYSACAKEALLSSTIIEKRLCAQVSVTSSYTISGKIQNKILAHGATMQDIVYTDVVVHVFVVEVSKYEQLEAVLIDVSSATCTINRADDVFEIFPTE